MIKYEHHRSFKKHCILIDSVKNLISCAHIHHSYEYITVTEPITLRSISDALGFNRVFNQYCACTPSQYRKSLSCAR